MSRSRRRIPASGENSQPPITRITSTAKPAALLDKAEDCAVVLDQLYSRNTKHQFKEFSS
jgi:hypothetical protein